MSTGIKKACCQLLSNHWLHWHFYCNLLGDLQAYETCSWYNKNSKRTRNSLVTDWTTSCNLSQINLSISHSTVKTSASRPLKWWCVFIWHWTSANLQIPVEQEHHIQTGCVNIYSNYGGGISSAISSVEGWKRIQLYPMISQPSLCIIGRGCGMQSGIWLWLKSLYTNTIPHSLFTCTICRLCQTQFIRYTWTSFSLITIHNRRHSKSIKMHLIYSSLFIHAYTSSYEPFKY